MHASQGEWSEKDIPLLRKINKTLAKAAKASRHFRNDVELHDKLQNYHDLVQPLYDGLSGKSTSPTITFKDGKSMSSAF